MSFDFIMGGIITDLPMPLQCSLCALPSEDQYSFEGKPFCCNGCKTVYSILADKGVEAFNSPPPEVALNHETIRIRLEIDDLFCLYCQDVIEWVLKRTRGVVQAAVDYSTDLCIVDYNPRQIGREEVFQKIRSLGYTPNELDEEDRPQINRLSLRFGLAAFFALNIMMFSYPIFVGLFEDTEKWGLLFAWASFFCTIPIFCYSAAPLIRKGFQASIRGFFGMEALVVMGVGASFILSTWNLLRGSLEVYYDTAAVVVTFVLLGKLMESKGKIAAKTQMKAIFRSIPKRARVNDRFILLKDLQENDIITSLCGEKIVADGMVKEGSAWVDASLVTGESTPQFVQMGEIVKSGSIITEGSLHYQKIEGPSMLESIVHMVEEALLKKKQAIGWLDWSLSKFVPLILCIAALFYITTQDLERVLAILLISCPCAIGIAAPLAESRLIEALLSIGVVVRNRYALKLLGLEKSYVFDKTGTLTTKEWDLKTDLGSAASLIKAMSLHSIHPIAKALVNALTHVSKAELKGIKEMVGCGIQAEEKYFLGSPKWLGLSSKCSLAFLEVGKPPLYIDLMDRIRPEIPGLLKNLTDVDLYLYSGDRVEKVTETALRLGIKNYEGDLLPDQKRERIEKLKKQGIVAFVGDGINDAAAIAEASLSFAPLHAADLSSQSADFFLTKDDLSSISSARALGRQGAKVLRQNIFLAFCFNVIGIPLAMTGFLSPWLATIFMMVSSLTVLFNSNRLFRRIS